MLKQLICATLLACSFGAHANDWYREFFSSMSNELPKSRGVAVDDHGNVHLQAFNKQPWSNSYEFAHLYTLNAQGHMPWIWGLSPVDRKSNCGVYARSGQRLDCFETSWFNGNLTMLEMRYRNSSDIVWQAPLPGALLDASIPTENTALVVGRLSRASGDELGVFRASPDAPMEVLSVVNACPYDHQTMTASRLRMPTQPNETIRHVKACWNSFGTTDLILEEFDLATGQWSTLSMWRMRFGENIAQMAINAEGKAFVLIEEQDVFVELLTSHMFGDQWQSHPFHIQGSIQSFLLNDTQLVVVSRTLGMKSHGPDTVTWFDLKGPFQPHTQPFPELRQYAVQGFALSSHSELIAVGYLPYQRTRAEKILLARRLGPLLTLGDIPLTINETTIGAPYVIGGPNNVAIIARNIERNGVGVQIGVRVNQYGLPF
jgi:hypothetical protein